MSEDLGKFLKGIENSYRQQSKSVLKKYEGIDQNDPNLIRSLVGGVLGTILMGYEINKDLNRLQVAVQRFNELSGLNVRLSQDERDRSYFLKVNDVEIRSEDSEYGPKISDPDLDPLA